MDWYYAVENERRGPVSQQELTELIRGGTITPATQIWRAGMENWKPLAEVDLAVAGTANGEAACVECRQTFPTSEMVQYAGVSVCANCKPVFFQKVKEGIEPARAMPYAGFWIRFVAKFVDGIIVSIPGYALQFGGAAIVGESEYAVAMVLITWLISFLLQLAYSTWMHGKWGATVGKMACGLRVVNAGGGRISYALACGRFFAEMLSGIILYIGYLMAAFDEEKRALHDRICNTRVIRTRA